MIDYNAYDPDEDPQGDPPPPPGFEPVQRQAAPQQADPPPPAGFVPVDSSASATPPPASTVSAAPKREDDIVENFKRDHPWIAYPTDFAQGVGAGMGSTARGLNLLANKGMSYLPGSPQLPVIPEKYAQPPNTAAGKLGFGTEQVAEFFVPGGATTKIGKAIDASSKLPWLAKAVAKAGVEAVPAASITLAQTGGDTDAALKAGAVAGGLSLTLPLIGKALTSWWGHTTGAGDVAIERAATKPTPELKAAMAGDITEKEILQATREAVSNVEKKRSAEFVNSLRKIDQSIRVDLKPARKATSDILDQFSIRKLYNPRTGRITLDFDSSPLRFDTAAQERINQLTSAMYGPLNNSPEAVHNLKRAVDSMYRDGKADRAIMESVRGSLADTLGKQVPGYQQMVSDYAKASDFLDNLADLSHDATNDGTAIRKLAGSLKQNNNYRRDLLEALDQYTHKDLVGQIAGSRLNSWAPRGIAGPLAATSGMGGLGGGYLLHQAAHDPYAFGVAMMGLFGLSPRLVGEAAVRARLASRFAKSGAAAAPSMLHVQKKEQPDYDANYGSSIFDNRSQGGRIGYAQGGKVGYWDGDVVEGAGEYDPNDPYGVLREQKRKQLAGLFVDPSALIRQPAPPRQAKPQRPAMGPPEAKREINVPDDTSFSGAMNQVNVQPEWMQKTTQAISAPGGVPLAGPQGSATSFGDSYGAGTGNIVGGLATISQATEPRDVAGGVGQGVSGGMEAALPLVAGSVKAPIDVLNLALKFGAGYLTQEGVTKATEHFGMAPEYANLLGVAAGLGAAHLTPSAMETAAILQRAPGEIQDFINDKLDYSGGLDNPERGSISRKRAGKPAEEAPAENSVLDQIVAASEGKSLLGQIAERPVASESRLNNYLREKLKGGKGTIEHGQTAHPGIPGEAGDGVPETAQGAPAGTAVQYRPPHNPALQQVATDYNAQIGLPPVDYSKYHPLDESFGRQVADAYDALKVDNSADPKVRAAYNALNQETKAQYLQLIEQGYKLEPWKRPGQPYKNSSDMAADLAKNKHLFYFQGGEQHPLMDAVDPDTGVSYTDMFRANHDARGHAAPGYGFGPRGEEGAFDAHSQSYSPLARQAMATETRGQNSWVNFGRHNYNAEGKLLDIPTSEKPFAIQKVDLLPPEMQQRVSERGQVSRAVFDFPMAGQHVDGMLVRDQIPNLGSIDSTLEEYDTLPGVREFPMSKLPNPSAKGNFYDVKDFQHVDKLAEQLKASGEIDPMIVVIDKEGPYVLEGAHRMAALHKMGKKSFPAKVVIDRSESSGIPRAQEAEAQGPARQGAPAGAPQVDPDTLRMLQVQGAQYILAGETDPKTWGAAMVNELGQDVTPHLSTIWEGAQSIASQASKDVKARTMDTLDARIPNQVRVVSPDATKTTTGQPFHNLDLDQKSEGFLPYRKYGEQAANQMEQRALQEAIQESEAGGGRTAADAVRSTGLRLPGSKFWDESFSLPQRARFWYELSGEAFTNKYMDVPREFQPAVIDAVSGTSGGVEPRDNLQRAIGILAENLQKKPVMVDLRDPASARKALDPQKRAEKTLKYGSFSGTMQYTAGLTPKAPLTTNDVQVASMFGIKGTDLGKNPILYEVLSRFYLKLRDAQNAEMGIRQAPGGWHVPDGAQPWETWQMQAPSWVQERIRKNPAKASQYDDYSQVFPSIIQQLQQAGVPTPGGKITMETLMDPRTPNVMSGTRENFINVPHATVEVATTQTPRGARAAAMAGHLESLDKTEPWVRDATAAYEQVQRNTMRDLAMRRTIKKGSSREQIADLMRMDRPEPRPEDMAWVPQADEAHIDKLFDRAAKGDVPTPSIVSQLMSHILGRKVDVSRLDWEGWGVFNGVVSPNLRIPMGGTVGGKEWVTLNPVQREAFLAILGQHFHQEAMAASHFQSVPHGQGNTFSVFLNRYDGRLDPADIGQFSQAIGLPVNVKQHPNGTAIDINLMDDKPKPTLEQVQGAADQIFGIDADIHEIMVFSDKYEKNLVEQDKYREKINAYQQARRADQVKAGKPRGQGQTGAAAKQTSDYQRLQKTLRRTAGERDAQFERWRKEAAQEHVKRLGIQPPPTALLPPRPRP